MWTDCRQRVVGSQFGPTEIHSPTGWPSGNFQVCDAYFSQLMHIRGVSLNCLVIFLLAASTALAQGSEEGQAPTENQQTEQPTTPLFREFLRDERDLWT